MEAVTQIVHVLEVVAVLQTLDLILILYIQEFLLPEEEEQQLIRVVNLVALVEMVRIIMIERERGLVKTDKH
jgi:hypothetical protein